MKIKDWFKDKLRARLLHTSWDRLTLSQLATIIAKTIDVDEKIITHEFNTTGSELSICFDDMKLTFHFDWKCSNASVRRVVIHDII